MSNPDITISKLQALERELITICSSINAQDNLSYYDLGYFKAMCRMLNWLREDFKEELLEEL